MIGRTLTLAIEKLAGLGDGVATHEGQKIFTPYTLAGDVIEAKITKAKEGIFFATLSRIITPSAQRRASPCPHFSHCGGCDLQHMNPADYQQFKRGTVEHALKKAGYDNIPVEMVFLSESTRRRVEFKVQNKQLGYFALRSNQLVPIRECHILVEPLQALLPALKDAASELPISHIALTYTGSAIDALLTLLPTAPTRADSFWQAWCDRLGVARISLQSAEGIRVVATRQPVEITLGKITTPIPPGLFLQATKEAQSLMTKEVLAATRGKRRLLDLFCGIGTFSFPLAESAKVHAAEGDTAMIDSMHATIKQNSLKGSLTAERRDLFKRPFNKAELAAYDAVIINPPRTGAKTQAEAIAVSSINTVVMISCNPATFARDAAILRNAGFTLEKVTGIDQFVYSTHLELMATFTRP